MQAEVKMNGPIIALDVGTTQIKAALLDEQGRILRLEKSATPLISKGERTVYEPASIWNIVKGQVERLETAFPKQPAGISIAGMAEAGLILDRKSGKELSNILPWFEQCTCPLAEQMPETEAARVFSNTGLKNSFKYGIYKYLWLLKEQQLKSEGTVWLSVCDYIIYRLTGKLVTDPTFAARTYVYNVRESKWDRERIENYGLTTENFPQVTESGAAMGTYRGIPVALAGHDHVCAAFGLLYGTKDGICDSAGTSETYIGLLADLGEEQGFPEKSGLLYGPFTDGGYFYMANVPSSGHSVEWFRKKLQMEELAYPDLNKKLDEIPSGPTGLVYLPYLTGMGAPWYRPDMKGVLLGLDERQDGALVLKGILEGIQFQARWLLELVEQFHKVHADSLICAGGSVHNHTFMQIKADILDRSVCVPVAEEATLCGAAALFLLKNQGRAEAEHFLENAVRTEKKYRPNPADVEAYSQIFHKRYLPLAEIMKTFWTEQRKQ